MTAIAENEGRENGFPRTRLSLLEVLRDWEEAGKWDEFAFLYSPIIRATARKAGLRDMDAEDVLQEVLLRVALNMKDEQRHYRPEGGPFRGWLLNLVRWKIGEQVRKIKRKERDKEAGTDEVIAEVPDHSAPIPENELARHWQEMLFNAAVDRVKDLVSLRQFQIFQLNVLKGMAAAEVCERLGVTRTQVYLAKLRVGRLVEREVQRLQKRTGKAGC